MLIRRPKGGETGVPIASDDPGADFYAADGSERSPVNAGTLVVTYPLTGRSRAIVADELSGAAEAVYLVDLAPADRAAALGRAWAVLSHNTSQELQPDEIPLIRNARLLQFTAAGVDWVPTSDLPRELPVAANKGGGAEPMSEHIVPCSEPA